MLYEFYLTPSPDSPSDLAVRYRGVYSEMEASFRFTRKLAISYAGYPGKIVLTDNFLGIVWNIGGIRRWWSMLAKIV